MDGEGARVSITAYIWALIKMVVMIDIVSMLSVTLGASVSSLRAISILQ